MENKFFLHQIKRTGGAIDKGIVVKDSYAGALQGYHAYGQNADTDFVSCEITDIYGARLMNETWVKQEQQEPEPDTEPEVS